MVMGASVKRGKIGLVDAFGTPREVADEETKSNEEGCSAKHQPIAWRLAAE
jgi:hypothetical protein